MKLICHITQVSMIVRMIMNQICKPCHNRGIGFVVIHTIHMLATMYVQTSLVTLDLIGHEVLLVMHGPYGGQYVHTWRYFILLDELPLIVLDMCFNFFHKSLYKLSCIRLLDHLMEAHDVTHHFCMEGNRVSHAFLKVQVIIMEQVCFSLAFGEALRSHVVHLEISIEITLQY